ncbi:hypothetical protein [Cyclobacterium xiamenense]|nr:hypothetical protein [Cyclobacterium xiamenense]
MVATIQAVRGAGRPAAASAADPLASLVTEAPGGAEALKYGADP